MDSEYTKLWIAYAESVKDGEIVYDYMIEHNIGINNPRVYISEALYVEKYKRDFQLSEQLHRKAVKLFKSEDKNDKLSLQTSEFSRRMNKRIERDVIGQLGEKELNQLFCKRKREDAFPDDN